MEWQHWGDPTRVCLDEVRCVDFPGGSDSEESTYKAGDPGSIPGSGRPPGKGNGNPLQCSCLENPMERGAWWAAYSPWGCKELDMTEQLMLSLPITIPDLNTHFFQNVTARMLFLLF